MRRLLALVRGIHWTHKRAAIAAGTVLAVVAAVIMAIASATSGAPADLPWAPGAHPKPTPTLAANVSPITGKHWQYPGKPIAVKIDNVADARPATGIDHAGLIYVLPVEGGLSRLMAVFSSNDLPPQIGPVRSARQTDLQLLRQFQHPAFVFSGATPKLEPYIAGLRWLKDLCAYPVFGTGYFRDDAIPAVTGSRSAPHDLYITNTALWAQLGSVGHLADIGFRFSLNPPAGGKPVAEETTGYANASYTFVWSATDNAWRIKMDGQYAYTSSGTPLEASTVVIQHTVIGTSPFKEYGSRPPYAHSTGTGKALVLRNGQAFPCFWTRLHATSGTIFTNIATGDRMTFEPGQIWVVLVS